MTKDFYTDEELEKDNEIVKELEEDYKNETDPVKKAEKELYYHYMYEARRMKLLAKGFQDMVAYDVGVLLEETEHYIYMDHLLGCSCPICRSSYMFAEKPWAEEMAKSLGQETWKDKVKHMEEDRKNRENNKEG